MAAATFMIGAAAAVDDDGFCSAIAPQQILLKDARESTYVNKINGYGEYRLCFVVGPWCISITFDPPPYSHIYQLRMLIYGPTGGSFNYY